MTLIILMTLTTLIIVMPFIPTLIPMASTTLVILTSLIMLINLIS